MILRVKPGNSVIATRLGEDRRHVYITPVGCAFDKPPAIPEGTDLSGAGYDVDPGPCERLIAEALKAGHKGLASSVELVDGAAPKAARNITRK